ncbi:unnamed protein product [Rotaria socialis]|uniref:Tetratricopeptide repeat protein n=1 Tax=Rotaria socialis TaxID=392032 RepID=A0A820Y5U3_9BILA|nr:unnamed protein product [Rotaria socialis]CAF3592394.1 unnamed protein product [Rotaria socialis]CAF4543192.1 unnamed protein product [Rotaria socialis]CAF4701329.1 unnamed protein product [Rotaria socialis]
MGYIHIINGNYKLAVKLLEQSVKMKRDNNMNSFYNYEILRDIGLLHMILGNYSMALASFKEALPILELTSDNNKRKQRLILKRIEEAKEALKYRVTT